ncbi:MAG: hypothetical protein P4L46_09390 [Fimbriimonas sp.]|nr:hypothetical protein [Fimbriimonas sp.]
MPNFDAGSTPRDKAVELIATEIAKADFDRVPTSRQKLGQLVSVKLLIPPAEAYKIVDEYCDDKAPGVPHYLQEEFAMPYLKVLAVVNSILGIAALWWAAHSMKAGKPSWPWFIVAAVLVGFSGLSFFKVVQRETSQD